MSCCLIYKVHTAFSGGLLFYHSVFSLSSTFFKFFQTLSCSHSRILSLRFAALADSLIILPRSFSLVKHFFQVFSNFFVPFRGETSWWRCPCRQLIEDITLGTICQALFSSFSNFFVLAKGLILEARSSRSPHSAKKKEQSTCSFFVLALPIFPVRLQTSIFGRNELNFRVRNGNGWTLVLINTNYFNHRSD